MSERKRGVRPERPKAPPDVPAPKPPPVGGARFEWEADEQRLRALEDGYERFREMDRKWKADVDQLLKKLEEHATETGLLLAEEQGRIALLEETVHELLDQLLAEGGADWVDAHGDVVREGGLDDQIAEVREEKTS